MSFNRMVTAARLIAHEKANIDTFWYIAEYDCTVRADAV